MSRQNSITVLGDRARGAVLRVSAVVVSSLVLISCQGQTQSGQSQGGRPTPTYVFVFNQQGHVISASRSLKVETLLSNRPTTPDEGVVLPPQPKPGSLESDSIQLADDLSVDNPRLYDSLEKAGKSSRALAYGNTRSLAAFLSGYEREDHVSGAEIDRIEKSIGSNGPVVFMLPQLVKKFPGSGPYRRVFTVPGFSYVDGSVYLPCKAYRLSFADNETGFVYVGGWGAGNEGTAVDAGFQHSSAYDNYSVIINAETFKQVSMYPRFVCGQDVAFKFYAETDEKLVFWAKGATTDGQSEAIVQAVLEHGTSFGWPSSGGGTHNGIIMKRMTTIGQKDIAKVLPPGLVWDADGSYFGHYIGDPTPEVQWSNLRLGQVGSDGEPIDLQPWGAEQTYTQSSSDALNYPDNPKNIWRSCDACSNEANAIDISGS